MSNLTEVCVQESVLFRILFLGIRSSQGLKLSDTAAPPYDGVQVALLKMRKCIHTMCMTHSEHEKAIVFPAMSLAEGAAENTTYCQKHQQMNWTSHQVIEAHFSS